MHVATYGKTSSKQGGVASVLGMPESDTPRAAWGSVETIRPPREHRRSDVTAPLHAAMSSIASRCVNLAGPWIPGFVRAWLWSAIMVSGIMQRRQEFMMNLTTSSLRYGKKGDLLLFSTVIVESFKSVPALKGHSLFLNELLCPRR